MCLWEFGIRVLDQCLFVLLLGVLGVADGGEDRLGGEGAGAPSFGGLRGSQRRG